MMLFDIPQFPCVKKLKCSNTKAGRSLKMRVGLALKWREIPIRFLTEMANVACRSQVNSRVSHFAESLKNLKNLPPEALTLF